jgi:hypothetical protein
MESASAREAIDIAGLGEYCVLASDSFPADEQLFLSVSHNPTTLLKPFPVSLEDTFK